MRWRRALLIPVTLVLLASGTPPPAQPATAKWEGPWVHTLFSRVKTTVYYGPWRCSRAWMGACERKCAREGHPLMGCMWLADIKIDGEGNIPLTGLEMKAGSRYAVTHCCCDYPRVSPEENERLRKKWGRHRDTFRDDWERETGKWPMEANGKPWAVHHIRDLQHGGDPVSSKNLLPTPQSVHDLLNEEYPRCYGGKGGWNQIGPDRPYSD